MIEVNWLLFVAASLVLIVTPGQDMILVMSRSIAQGAVAGVATATGVCSGLVVHTVVAALGLGALIRASEWLYFGLQLGGAAYLAHLGLQLLRAPQRQLEIAGSAHMRPARMFFDGALSNNHASLTSETRIALQGHIGRVTTPTDGMAEFEWVI